MKKIFFLILLPIFFGCEEIIELDLNSSNPEIIIEANLSNTYNFVLITESTDYYNPNKYIPISNAEVIIRENDGTSYFLEETAPGEYGHNNLLAVPESQYTIEVNYDEKVYSAASYAPPTIYIDSIDYKLEDVPFHDEKNLELHVYFQDNPDQSDYARFVVYKNGDVIKKRIFLYEDRLANGNYIDFFFFNFDDEVFQSGDEITVQMLTIDELAFTYYKTLRKAIARSGSGPFGPAAPANPISNWSNNAFGYFSAFSIDSKSLVIK